VKALEVSSLFYEVQWNVQYEYGAELGPNMLDGVYGTPDLLDRIKKLTLRNRLDDVDPEDFSRKLSKMNEAGLVIRNLSLLEDNARYLSEQCPLRDFLTIALNLPSHIGVIELKHYALDIAEQLTKYWSLASTDPLYISLLEYLKEGRDRGAILTSLRAISRIAMNLEVSNRLGGIPLSIIKNLIDWTLLDDEELVAVCLDFFYQFTAVPENITWLITHVTNGSLALHPLITRLGHLLLHNAQHVVTKRLIAPAILGKTATEIPELPPDLLEQIVQYNEPERSSQWLRACFEENAECEITQIALWQAYQTRFTRLSSMQNPLLAAADFIKNVSTTFPTANAQVINGHPNPRFIIKGIRPRWVPVTLKGQAYSSCQWKSPESERACGKYLLAIEAMWEHVVTEHLGLTRNEDRRWNVLEVKTAAALHGQKFNCYWGGCRRFGADGGTDSPYDVAMHFKVHLPDVSEMALHRSNHTKHGTADRTYEANRKDEHGGETTDVHGRPPVYQYLSWHNTITDEHGNPVGLPLTSVLVLKNLARNIPRAVTGVEGLEGELGVAHGSDGWVERLLGPLKSRLAFVLAYNRPLTTYVSELIIQIQKGTTGS
jgi:chromatin structure-remodeling complex subunit RSC9